MSPFDQINEEILRGMDGKNNSLPMGFERLNRYVSIRKRIYTLIFGGTGTGKSALVHEAFILRPFEWWLENKTRSKLKPHVILFSQERSKLYTLTKWLSRKIFLDTGKLIPINKMLGWWSTKITSDEKELIDSYRGYIEQLCQFVTILEGGQTPNSVLKYVDDFAARNGRIEGGEYNKIYIPNNENQIVIPIIDHLGLTKTGKDFPSKKEAIDKVSEHFQKFRDFYGYSPVAVSQTNRDLGSFIYKGVDNLEPTLDHAKESGRPAEDADVVMSLFQPSRYKTSDPSYHVPSFLDPSTGGDYFRSVKILKNSYGEADVRCGMGFMGVTGSFKELPRKTDMMGFDYDKLFDGRFFRESKLKPVNFR